MFLERLEDRAVPTTVPITVAPDNANPGMYIVTFTDTNQNGVNDNLVLNLHAAGDPQGGDLQYPPGMGSAPRLTSTHRPPALSRSATR